MSSTTGTLDPAYTGGPAGTFRGTDNDANPAPLSAGNLNEAFGDDRSRLTVLENKVASLQGAGSTVPPALTAEITALQTKLAAAQAGVIQDAPAATAGIEVSTGGTAAVNQTLILGSGLELTPSTVAGGAPTLSDTNTGGGTGGPANAASGPFAFEGYTVSTLPSATTYAGDTITVTGGQAGVGSNGYLAIAENGNWYWVGSGGIVS